MELLVQVTNPRVVNVKDKTKKGWHLFVMEAFKEGMIAILASQSARQPRTFKERFAVTMPSDDPVSAQSKRN